MKNISTIIFPIIFSFSYAYAGSANDKNPINIVVGYQAGGGTDVFARIISEKLQLKLNKPVIVINKPGATGAISASYVSDSKPDGNTLLLTPGSFSFAQFVLGAGSGKPPYDPISQFTPISQLANVPLFLVTNKKSGIENINDLKNKLKVSNLNYGTTGTGSVFHIIGEEINRTLSEKKLIHIPYKGVSPAVNDLVAGHIPLVFTSLDAVFPYLQDKSLKLIATTGATRSNFAPEIPTLKESGIDVNMSTWYGLFGNKNIKNSIVEKLNTEINEILKDPAVISKAEVVLGAEISSGEPEKLDILNKSDYKKYQEIVKSLDLN